MGKPRRLSRLFLTNMVILATVSIGGTGALWIYGRVARFRRDVAEVRARQTGARKDLVRGEVVHALRWIEHERTRGLALRREKIREYVHMAHATARGIHEKYHGIKTPGEVQTLIIEALRVPRTLGGRGYFFITGFDGTSRLWADRPEMEGRSILDLTDSRGKFPVRDLIRVAREKGEGFLEYTMTRPGAEGDAHPKLAFVKRFEPYDWYIGSGEYLEDLQADLKAEVVDRLDRIKSEHVGYLFAGQWDGVALCGPAKGRNMIDTTDAHGVKVVRELIAASRQAGGGFVEYVMPPLEGHRSAPKISYVAAIPEWQWYVGAGVYVGDIEDVIAARQDRLKRAVARDLGIALAFLAVLMLLAGLIARRVARTAKAEFRTFSDFLASAAGESRPVDPGEFRFEEFRELARAGNRMIAERDQAEGKLRESEERLRHSQKMEAVGQLAGGVAHDFNNLLTAILGNAQLLGMDCEDDSPQARQANQIVQASMRAADLTRQLLAFGRKGPVQTKRVDVHELIEEAIELLRHSLDRRIEIVFRPEARPSTVRGDASQLQNAILNLGVNARDAMPEGGTLTFATRTVNLDEEFCRLHAFEIEPGPHLALDVIDTGVGIDDEVRERIFEPFFTTKGVGKGTGLGLAGAYGCVKGHHGLIHVDSTPGEGSTFTVLLPLADAPAEAEAPAPAAPPRPGRGRILVVDDEELVRHVAAASLRNLGYEVQECPDGAAAVAFIREDPHRVDLVILDMVMPKLSGEDTFRLLRDLNPHLPILIASGYSRGATVDALLAEGAVGFLTKPFRLESLAGEVARHLPAGE